MFKKKLFFSTTVQFSQFNLPFIANSQGRITLKLNGHKKGCDLFLPLIVGDFEPKDKVDPAIVEKHKNIEQKISQHEKDLQNYNAEKEQIRQATTKKEGNIEICDYSERDRLESELEEKYKDAIKWRGPLFAGVDLLPFVLKTCLELITVWIVKNSLQDLNDALWDKFKKTVKQVFSAKKAPIVGKDDIALVIKQGGKKTTVFLFETSLTLEETEDALSQARKTFMNLSDEILNQETYKPVVFRFNKSIKQWGETSDWVQNDISDRDLVGHVENVGNVVVALSSQDYIEKLRRVDKSGTEKIS